MNRPGRITDDSSSFIVCVVLDPCREMVEIWQIADMGKYFDNSKRNREINTKMIGGPVAIEYI